MHPSLRLAVELPPVPVGGRGGTASLEPWWQMALAAVRAGAGTVWITGGPTSDGTPRPANGCDACTIAAAAVSVVDTVLLGVVSAVPVDRHPAVLARDLTALDVVSGGRAAVLLRWSGTPGLPGAPPRSPAGLRLPAALSGGSGGLENGSGLADERGSGLADERGSGLADERGSGLADERGSGLADERGSGLADERGSGLADERGSGLADERGSGLADERGSGLADERGSGLADERGSGLSAACEHLGEAVAVCRSVLRDDTPVFEGTYLHVAGAVNRPRPRRPDGPPLLVELPAGAVGLARRDGGPAFLLRQASSAAAAIVCPGDPGEIALWRALLEDSAASLWTGGAPGEVPAVVCRTTLSSGFSGTAEREAEGHWEPVSPLPTSAAARSRLGAARDAGAAGVIVRLPWSRRGDRAFRLGAGDSDRIADGLAACFEPWSR